MFRRPDSAVFKDWLSPTGSVSPAVELGRIERFQSRSLHPLGFRYDGGSFAEVDILVLDDSERASVHASTLEQDGLLVTGAMETISAVAMD